MFTKLTGAAVSIATAVLMAVLLFPAVAGADDWTDVNPGQDGVDIGVGTGEEQPGSGGTSGGGDATGDEGGGGGTSVPAGQCPNYQYELVDSDSGSYKGASAGTRPSEEHRLMGRWCRNPHTGTTQVGAEWVLPGEDGTPVVDPAVLAQQAVDSLRLPRPRIAASPEAAQLVRLPVWLWLDGASWVSQSASASVPGLTVTATAVPVEAAWVMGDGTTVECSGPGTAWKKSMGAKAESPDCGHTYTQPSRNELKVTVTVSWQVTWSGGGESGSVPGMVTTASVSWTVTESHALVR